MSSQKLTTFRIHETRRSFSLRVCDIVGKLPWEIRHLSTMELIT